MVHNHSRQIIETAPRVGEPCARQILQQVAGHVQSVQRKLDENVQFGPRVGCPTEPFDVEAEHVGQPADPELFGGGLLGLADVAEEPLRVRQLLHLHKLLQAVVDMADGRRLALFGFPHRT